MLLVLAALRGVTLGCFGDFLCGGVCDLLLAGCLLVGDGMVFDVTAPSLFVIVFRVLLVETDGDEDGEGNDGDKKRTCCSTFVLGSRNLNLWRLLSGKL